LPTEITNTSSPLASGRTAGEPIQAMPGPEIAESGAMCAVWPAGVSK